MSTVISPHSTAPTTPLPAWPRCPCGSAGVVKAVPDTAQRPVRALALEAGELLYVAVPMLADPLPFYQLDPRDIDVPPTTATTGPGMGDT
ncbi:MAG TPA: hypothetical protein VFX70_15035 [Mycobacteriales bacterium]|nr:hypothetical protein [Mycobacteriales bacterium]